MADRLARYREKRDAAVTPEPAGDPQAPESERRRFVVQEHHARRLHWDLRLEHDGVLASWAVPRGIPPDPQRNHLAVRTEDHPLEYLEFHGEIPAGQYGAGTMKIWDRGTYEEHKFRDDEVMVTFHGERVRGRYVLFRTKGDDWMIHRMDPPQDPDREPMPDQIAPMLARTGPLPPEDGGWAYEIKWDGVRAIAFISGGRLTLAARTGRDITPRYPELRPLGAALAGREVILDGEVVAFDGARPSFQKLQGRMHLTSDHAVRRLAQSDPVHYIAFDLLYLDGRSQMDLRYDERRERLAELELAGPTWQAPAHHVGDGAALLEATRAQQLEGIVAKRLDCPYTPGRRSSGWVKVKNICSTDVVDRGLAAGRGRAQRAPRRAGAGHPRRRRRAPLRRPRRHRLHRGGARAARPRARAARAGHQPVHRHPAAQAHALRRAAARRTRRLHRAHAGPARCASRPTRACATTWRPRTCGWGRRRRMTTTHTPTRRIAGADVHPDRPRRDAALALRPTGGGRRPSGRSTPRSTPASS